MPLNIIDYTKIPYQKNDYSGLTDLVKNFMEGYEASQKPQKMQHEMEKLKQEALQGGHRTNIMGAEAKFAEKSFGGMAEQEALKAALLKKFGAQEKELALKETMANIWATKNPDKAHVSTDITRLWNEREEDARKYGEDSPRVKSKDKQIEKENSMLGRGGLSDNARIFNSLPKAVQNEQIATAAGFGIDPLLAARRLSGGALLEDLQAEQEAKGIDTSNSRPIYSSTTSNITKQKEMDGALAQLNVLEKHSTAGIKDHLFQIMGYSPKNFFNAISGKNKKEQGKYLAARSVYPEISGERIKLSNGSNAHESVKDITDKSLGNSKVFQNVVDSETYQYMQDYIHDWFKEGNESRQEIIYGTTPKKKAEKEAAEKAEALRNAQNGDKEVITEADILHTAQEEGIPVYMVKERLKAEGRM
jgi:hypothetical protein